MLIPILVVISSIIVVFVIIVATRPSDFRVTRGIKIASPQGPVFAQVNDFHRWQVWSPWEKLDPALKRTYEGPASGVGSIYSWIGNKQVGSGRMTIMQSQPSELIRIKLEFLKPFKATNTAEFIFKSEGNQTAVTWNMIGNNNFMMKGFSMFMNMDKMIGTDFEKGLAQLKQVVESGNKL